MGTILCGIPYPFHGGGPIEGGVEPSDPAAWKTVLPEFVFIAGEADSISYGTAIDNYTPDTLGVFPTRQWFRAAQLAGMNMATCIIGVTPTKERTQISSNTSTVTGSMLVDFELRPYRPYVASVTGRGLANPTGRDVDVTYSVAYDPPRTFTMRIFEPALGSPPFKHHFYAPGKGGGKVNYQPVAEVCCDMGIAMTVGDYPDTNTSLGGLGEAFDSQLRSDQFNEWMTLRCDAAIGWASTDTNSLGGHSGGCNTADIQYGLKHEDEETGEPVSFATVLIHGNKPVCSIMNSSQAIDNLTTPYEDSYTTCDANVPTLCLTGEYDPDRKFNTVEPRRRMYDDIPGPAILRFHLYAYHAFGTFTGDNRLDTQHVEDWLVKDYCLNLMRAYLDYYHYGTTAGLNFILNNSYLPSQIISTHEEHGY